MNTLEIRKTINELRVAKEAYFKKINRLESRLSRLLREQDSEIKRLTANVWGGNVLNIPLCELDLSVRAYNVLASIMYTTFKLKGSEVKVKDIVKLSLNDFMKMRNCGQKSLSEIEQVLFELGLKLKK
jgi:DNA-directed RNA polymerase alpha subunit